MRRGRLRCSAGCRVRTPGRCCPCSSSSAQTSTPSRRSCRVTMPETASLLLGLPPPRGAERGGRSRLQPSEPAGHGRRADDDRGSRSRTRRACRRARTDVAAPRGAGVAGRDDRGPPCPGPLRIRAVGVAPCAAGGDRQVRLRATGLRRGVRRFVRERARIGR